jgi:hypothetical protein
MIRKDGVLYNCCGCTSQSISTGGCGCTKCSGPAGCETRTDCATGCDTFHSGCTAVCPCPDPGGISVCYIPGEIKNPYTIFDAELWVEGNTTNCGVIIDGGEHSSVILCGGGAGVCPPGATCTLHDIASWSPGGSSTITTSTECCNAGCGYTLTLHWCICGTVPAP